MVRHAALADSPKVIIDPDAQHRCICCDGVITNLSDEAFSIGLELKLGLVSDECALICNACTAKLVEARKLGAKSAKGR
jgi:hypothetical protein